MAEPRLNRNGTPFCLILQMGYEASASARIGVIVSLPCAHKKLIADKKKQKSKNDTKKQKLNDDAEAKEASEFDHEEVEAVLFP